jgi:hypothetical protein
MAREVSPDYRTLSEQRERRKSGAGFYLPSDPTAASRIPSAHQYSPAFYRFTFHSQPRHIEGNKHHWGRAEFVVALPPFSR